EVWSLLPLLLTQQWRPSLSNIVAFAGSRRCRTKYAKSPAAYYNNSDATFNLSLVPLSGDVELNPGPVTAASNVLRTPIDSRDIDGVDHHNSPTQHQVLTE